LALLLVALFAPAVLQLARTTCDQLRGGQYDDVNDRIELADANGFPKERAEEVL